MDVPFNSETHLQQKHPLGRRLDEGLPGLCKRKAYPDNCHPTALQNLSRENCWERNFSTHLRIQLFPQRSGSSLELPSGYLTVCHGKSPFFSSVNHLFQWAIYTMAMLNNQRVHVLHRSFHRSFWETPWPQTRRGQSGRPPKAAASTPGPPRCRMGCWGIAYKQQVSHCHTLPWYIYICIYH